MTQRQQPDEYYSKHKAALAEIGVSAQDWADMQNREARMRVLATRGLSHKRATEIVYNVDLSDNPDWK